VEAIHLWWIGEKDPGARTLEHLRLHLGRALVAPVRIWEDPARPLDAYDQRRKQWSTSRILAWMARSAPPGKVLAVTDQDLFIPILTFVFGEAQLDGRYAVVSTARLGEPGLPDPRVALDRLAKEGVHELGHCFGLVHCDSPGCVMGRSPSARDVDRKRGEFCSKCRDRLTRGGGEAR
jgi:archaemetzincin